MIPIWMEPFVSALGSSEALQRLAASFRQCGLDVTAPRASVCAAGVVVLDELDEACEEAIRERVAEADTRVIVVVTGTGNVSAPMVWRMLSAGASDVVQAASCEEAARAVAARVKRWQEVDALLATPEFSENVVGTSRVFRQCVRKIVEVAAFTSASILLLGESGTGKEEMARVIHALDRRSGKRDFVVLDCSALVPELSGSEFFGHERGAFTGAIAQRNGAFALAERGTLFLDEVGELPTALQAQLLRVVQERNYKRVGGNTWQHADFRLISATNRDLAAEVESKQFRGDFYHRIAGWVFRLPALRERRADILPLAEHFVRQCLGPQGASMDERVREFLVARDYPGNVRELRQVVGRLCALHVGTGPLTIGDISREDLPQSGAALDRMLDGAVEKAVANGIGLKEIVRTSREAAIRVALEINSRNVQQAAKLLRVTDRALQMELAKREP